MVTGAEVHVSTEIFVEKLITKSASAGRNMFSYFLTFIDK